MIYPFPPSTAVWSAPSSGPIAFGAPGPDDQGRVFGSTGTIHVIPPAQVDLGILGRFGPGSQVRRELAVDRGEIDGIFNVGTLPEGARFESDVSCIGPGRDAATTFALEVAPSDGSGGWTSVASVTLHPTSSQAFVADLSPWAGTAVLVALKTASVPHSPLPRARVSRVRQPASCCTGVWGRPRIGSPSDLDTALVGVRLRAITILQRADPGGFLSLGVDDPRVAALAYAVDGNGFHATELDIAMPPAPIPPTWAWVNREVRITCRRMVGAGDPGSAFVGFAMLCIELDKSSEPDRARIAADFRTSFLARADALLKAFTPASGSLSELTPSESTALRAQFDAMSDSLSDTLVNDFSLPQPDRDDLIGVAHVSWTRSEIDWPLPPPAPRYDVIQERNSVAPLGRYELSAALTLYG